MVRILRFGKVDRVQNAAAVASIDRLVAEFFTVKAGKIQEVQAVLVNVPDAEPSDTRWYGSRPRRVESDADRAIGVDRPEPDSSARQPRSREDSRRT